MERWTMQIQDKSYEVQVTFKKMKTVRLRVVAGGQIRLSAPYRTSRVWLEQFLWNREEWIRVNVEKMSQIPVSDGSTGTAVKAMTGEERREALAYLMPIVEKWYPVVAAHGVAMPHVTVRRMSSRYGSCSVGRSRITLAAVLLQVPRECAEYVVLHELTHFLYPNHGRAFYQFIEAHMPDYKQREKRLKEAQIVLKEDYQRL